MDALGFERHLPEVGSRPGTLAIPPGSPPPKITLVQYDAAGVERREISDAAELRELRRGDRTTWVDIQGLGDEDEIREVGAVFELHPLALEHAVNIPQRAKTELYAHQQLIIARTPMLEDDQVRTPQVCFVLGEDYLITFQERYFGFFDPVRRRLEDGLGPMRGEGPDYLAYALIDAMVDRYYPVAQSLADQLEELEDFVIENPHPQVLLYIHALRQRLAVLRRVGWPQRDSISAMLRDRSPFVSDETKVYFRDTYDHIAQIVELIDSSREMVSALAEAYHSNVSHRTNEIMKMLTLMASIFIPLTFVAGIYGMNFENMPELHTRFGYFAILVVMAIMAVGMWIYFRRRGWIGSPPPPLFQLQDDLEQD
ncbi:MAG: magnesium/cobalt transporter CorA [Deltaproteobacteria bacterium]|jgi:magnesium transporter|nr:magnesium/cobalt transporter CorA [Deltaproteobacteria bacterium]MBW2500079.1 magnesium/cobalt transporter CorA [Deltaproteobacteria bacterium]